MGRDSRTELLKVTVFAAAVAFAACGPDRSDEVAIALRQIGEREWTSRVDPLSKEINQFYAQRNGRPAWVGDSRRIRGAVDTLNRAPEHGFEPSDFGLQQIEARLKALEEAKNDSPESATLRARLDADVTAAMIAFGRDVALGRQRPNGIDPRRKVKREIPSIATALASAADGDLRTWPDAVRPQHPEYAALQHALGLLHAQAQKGGWPPVPAAKLKPGVSDASVGQLRQRLAASGFLKAEASLSGSIVYDADVEAGVREFQTHHGLKPTGIVDEPTSAALNVPIGERIEQVAVNLERWRWMPDDLGARHFIVNIPYFHLVAREQGQPVMDIRVVVGAVDNKTPIFSGDMTTVVFSPYWHIPESIVEGETAPLVSRDPGYLERHQIEVLRPSKTGATPVEPSSVDWDNPDELRQLAFRQRPGPRNALGHVKFLFPNSYNVYLHDTPSDSLFARPRRAFSHGCIRVEEPETLARYVLRARPEWTDERILKAMRSGEEQHVKLDQAIPVHIVYFTAWVDQNGGLHFQPDIYKYD